MVQEHIETFFAQVETETGLGLPDFVKDEFDAFLECGILAHGFLRLRCADCSHEKLVAFSCKRRGFCPSCGGQLLLQVNAGNTRILPTCVDHGSIPGESMVGRGKVRHVHQWRPGQDRVESHPG
ncbi:transposase zinc-binding domain-containing protein [Nitrosomonas sp. Nm33]|uniref:transposase zinc-binding domain-containing protein n=1 Tax=Nitrosomonas sp. Nm33 TaxID=133724 RepID=UPI001C40A50E